MDQGGKQAGAAARGGDDSPAAPLAIHPENPRYFVFRGKPEFLITSGEHYGAVLNLDFRFVPYLDELQTPIDHQQNQSKAGRVGESRTHQSTPLMSCVT